MAARVPALTRRPAWKAPGARFKQVRTLLSGFHQMEEHFRTAPFERNLPVLMGLLAFWYNDFFGAQTVAVLPYDQYLMRFPAYLQRLTMESNGKPVRLDGKPVSCDTGPVDGGEPGTNGQHSFDPLIHQGTRLIRCDFIAFARPLSVLGRHCEMLMACSAAPTSASRNTRSTPRPRRCAIRSATGTTSIWPTSRRCGGAAA